MSIRFRCDHCRAALCVKRHRPQATLRCPKCRSALTLPGASDPRPKKAAPRVGPRRWLLACASAAVVLLTGIAAISAALTVSPVAEETTSAPEPTPVAAASRPTPPRAASPVEAPAIVLRSLRKEPAATAAPKARPVLPARTPPKSEAPPVVAVKQAPPKPARTPPKPPVRVVLLRRQQLEAEELRKELLEVPEIALDSVPNTSRTLLTAARLQHARGLSFAGPTALGAKRLDLAMLPLRMGKDCHLGKEPAEALQVLSRRLRANLDACAQRAGDDMRPDAAALRKSLLVDQAAEWLTSEAVPTLMQMLQAEATPVRHLLIELLERIKGRPASAALARRASTDLSPEVREHAVRALKKRPADEVAPVLVDLLSYPWAPVAEHAAEALVALDLKEALPKLRKALTQPDPVLPVFGPLGSRPVLREVVRVNHTSNCMLCHPPSFSDTDLVRGAIPGTGKPSGGYQGGQDSVFVRADVTYLRQDFSVVQPVENPKGGAAFRRYDYMVRERPLLASVADAMVRRFTVLEKPSRQREALLFALRELTASERRSRSTD